MLREKNQQDNVIAIIKISQNNLDEHSSTKVNTFRIYRGGGGGLEAGEFLKKSNKMETFP